MQDLRAQFDDLFAHLACREVPKLSISVRSEFVWCCNSVLRDVRSRVVTASRCATSALVATSAKPTGRDSDAILLPSGSVHLMLLRATGSLLAGLALVGFHGDGF